MMSVPFERSVPQLPWTNGFLSEVAHYLPFAEAWAGARAEGGLYRVHTATTGAVATEAMTIAFPAFDGRINLFGYDWLGRQFGLDGERTTVDGSATVLLFEPGTGEVLELPYSLDEFHNDYDELREPAFAGSFFDAWREAHPETLPLRPEQCIGYRQPLFLGGADELSNLELSDLDVYLTIAARLWAQVRDLPPGSQIESISL